MKIKFIKTIMCIFALLLLTGCKSKSSWEDLHYASIGVSVDKNLYATGIALPENHLLVPLNILKKPGEELIVITNKDEFYRENINIRNSVKYSVVAKSLNHSLAVLKIEGLKLNSKFKFEYKDFPKVGEDIYFIGGSPTVLVKGIQGAGFIDKDSFLVQTNFPLSNNYTYVGGAVLNKDKKVVGVLYYNEGNSYISYALRMDNVMHFLLDYNLLYLLKN
jgi:hypothetical protein